MLNRKWREDDVFETKISGYYMLSTATGILNTMITFLSLNK